MAEGIAAIQCGAFHNTTGGLTYFEHDAAGPRRDWYHAGCCDERRWRDLGDGSTYKGNDIKRFYRYRL
ncbi:hypothetical protein ACNKHT_20740 [Shigella flexneri]